MMDTVEILTKARELISDEGRWTRLSYARDADGNVVRPNDPDAVCFCAMGALLRASKKSMAYEDEEIPGFSELRKAMRRDVTRYNDAFSHKAVVLAFDRAIELAKAGA
jgi:hypothetical protein